jgi:hypothetical protein
MTADDGVPIPESVLVDAASELGEAPTPEAEVETPEESAPTAPPTEETDHPEATDSSGEAAEEPSTPPQGAETSDSLHPVLQRLPEDVRGVLKGFTDEQLEAVGKVRSQVFEPALTKAQQDAARFEGRAKMLEHLVKNPDALAKALKGDEQGAPADQPAKRPMLKDFDTADEWQEADTQWLEQRETRLLETVRAEQAGYNPTVTLVRNALAAERTKVGDAVPDHVWQVGVEAYDRSIANDPAKVAALNSADAIKGVRAILTALGYPLAPVTPPLRTTSALRPTQAASVPARSTPQPAKATPIPAWKKRGDLQPTPLEAAQEAGWFEAPTAHGTTRAPARNGAATKR